MTKVSVMREVTDLTGAELLSVYETTSGTDKDAARAEIVRRLDPPAKARAAQIDPKTLLQKASRK